MLFLTLLFLFWESSRILTSAAGWVDQTVDGTAEYSMHPLANYRLDAWVDESGDFLGISTMGYGILNAIANMIFWIAKTLSYFFGWVLEQAYTVDFIGEMIDLISVNIQKIAGVDQNGFRATGLLPALAPILILLAGVYLIWVGAIKQQVVKAASNLAAFILVFILGMGAVAYSGSYLNMINDFQRGLNQEIMDISAQIVNDGDSSVSQMRDNLFIVMVKTPYLLFQYGTSNIDEIGEDRVEELLSAEPGSEERQNIVKVEVEERQNNSMKAENLGERVGMTLVVLVVDLIVGVCVMILSALMIMGQVLFVLYTSFFPVALTFSLFPSSGERLRRLLNKCMETIMIRPGITIILTLVFSLSMVCYNLSSGSSFFWMMFLQAVIYITAVYKCKELLGFVQIGGGQGTESPKVPFARMMMLSRMMQRKHRRKEPDNKDKHKEPDSRDKRSSGWSFFGSRSGKGTPGSAGGGGSSGMPVPPYHVAGFLNSVPRSLGTAETPGLPGPGSGSVKGTPGSSGGGGSTGATGSSSPGSGKGTQRRPGGGGSTGATGTSSSGSGKGTQRRPGGGGSTGATGTSSSGSGKGTQRRPGGSGSTGATGSSSSGSGNETQRRPGGGGSTGATGTSSSGSGNETQRRPGGGGSTGATGTSSSGSGKGTQRRPGGGGSTGATGASSSGSGNGSQRRPGVPANKNVKGQTAQRGPENRQNEKAEGKRAGTSKKDSIYKAENTYERGGGRGAFDKTDKSRSFKNIEQRNYDFDELERQLTNADLGQLSDQDRKETE